MKILSAAWKAKPKIKINYRMAFRTDYHDKVMKLNERKQRRYLHPAIAEKIAKEIHNKITERKS